MGPVSSTMGPRPTEPGAGARPFPHEHRGPALLTACVWRLTDDTSGECGIRPGTERGPSVEDERGVSNRNEGWGPLLIAPVPERDRDAHWETPCGIWAVPSFVGATVGVSWVLSPRWYPQRDKRTPSNPSKPAGAGETTRTVMHPPGARSVFFPMGRRPCRAMIARLC